MASKLAKRNKALLKGRQKRKPKHNKDFTSLRTSCRELHTISYGTEQERKASFGGRKYVPRDNSKRSLNEYVPSRTKFKQKRYKVFDNV
jgi:hypothetical protein